MNKNLNKNTMYNILKSCSAIVFPLLTFPYVSRVVQATNIGKINFSNSIVSYFFLIASLGITTYAIRECSKVKNNKKSLEKVASEIYSINIITTIFSYLLLFILLIFSRKLENYKELIMIQSLSIAFCTLGADWLNNVMEDFRYIALRTFAFQVISLILMYIFVKSPNDFMIYVLITLISTSGGNIVNYFYRKKYCKISFTFKMNILKHLPSIITLFAMILAQQIFVNSDITIIGMMLNDLQVGLYTTAVKIYTLFNTLMSSIAWVVMPKLSIFFKEKDYKGVNEVIKYVTVFTFTIGIPLVIGMFLLSPEIIRFIAGNSYIDAVPVLKMLSVSLMFSLGWGIVMNMILLPSEKDKICLFSCVICAIVNLILNFILIPRFGIVAAAFTTAIAQFIGVYICLRGVEDVIKISLCKKDIISIILGCVFECLIIMICKYYIFSDFWILLTAGVCSILVYLIILILLKNTWVSQILNEIRK